MNNSVGERGEIALAFKEKLEEELEKTKGGIGFWGIAGIIGAAIFIVGVLDGIARPVKCN